MKEVRQVTECHHEAGRELLCEMLGKKFELHKTVEELEQEIAVSDKGKPYLRNYPEIHFNISHCKDWVACAVSDAPIGIDIEQMRKFRPSMLRKLLSDTEKQYILSYEADEEMYQKIFFRFWTLKEAYLKWKGTGFFKNPRTVTFTFEENGTITCSDKEVVCEQEMVAEDCIMAVVKTKKLCEAAR